MGPLAAIAAPIVAPLVGQVAGGLLQGVTKGVTGALGGIADSFGKVAGGLAQNIFGAIGGGLPGMLGGIAGKGLLPMPPIGLQPPGCFGPKHQGPVNVNINLGQLLAPNGPLTGKLEGLAKSLESIMGKLNDMVGQAGQKPEKQGIRELLQQILKAVQNGGGAQGGQAAGGASSAGGTSSAGGAEAASSAGGSSGALGEKALDGAFGKLNSLQDKLDKLDPESKTYQADVMKLQQQMQQITQTISMISEMRKGLHDAVMGVLQKLR